MQFTIGANIFSKNANPNPTPNNQPFGDETVKVYGGAAQFSTLKGDVKFFLTIEGLVQPMSIIEKRENNILYLSDYNIEYLTINYF
jgi:hypothetical protein